MSVFLDLALKGSPITVWGDGSVVWDYIYEDDLAEAVVSVAVKTNVDGVFNIGSGTGVSVREVIALPAELTGMRDGVDFRPARHFDVPYNVLDIGKVTAATGWKPSCSLREGMARTVRHLRNRASLPA